MVEPRELDQIINDLKENSRNISAIGELSKRIEKINETSDELLKKQIQNFRRLDAFSSDFESLHDRSLGVLNGIEAYSEQIKEQIEELSENMDDLSSEMFEQSEKLKQEETMLFETFKEKTDSGIVGLKGEIIDTIKKNQEELLEKLEEQNSKQAHEIEELKNKISRLMSVAFVSAIAAILCAILALIK